jgi:hypothetical protein
LHKTARSKDIGEVARAEYRKTSGRIDDPGFYQLVEIA